MGCAHLRRRTGVVAVICALAGCGQGATATSAPPLHPAAVDYGYRVVHAFPHDPRAFTEGLILRDGSLYESTGLYDQPSTLRQVELTSGRVLHKVELPLPYFGEGLTDFGDHLIQLTWKSHKAFVYDLATLQQSGEFSYDGEGWGLTRDTHSLIMSNGTDKIAFRDPATFAVTRTIAVRDGIRPVPMLNELEWVRGEIYANVFMSDTILRIDPATGAVVGRVNMRGLRPPDPRVDAVLNGIAYDPAADRLFVTGKFSPSLYEVGLTRR